MPMIAWRIGHAAVQCDGCGVEESSAGFANGYAALLARGWSERGARARTSIDWMTLELERGPRERSPLLLCPACSRAPR
jgi:hypothetical protein